MFDHPAFAGHERVVWHAHRDSGLKAIVAIHDTTLGPAAGGLRRWGYPSDEAALGDVLRLSRGMTYKNALAGVPFGGGKAVMFGAGPASTAELHAFGALVESLNGLYVTAEDVGLSVADLRRVAERTRYVSGIGETHGGDPSPWTALGVFEGIQVAVELVRGTADVGGLRVGIQGLGNVGFATARLLAGAGAKLLVADLDSARTARAAAELGAEIVPVDELARRDMDVFAPCALGGVLTMDLVEQLRAPIVAGAANNQLAEPEVGAALMRRGILYAPDYVINAGGIISVAYEYLGTARGDTVREAVVQIGPRLKELFESARRAGRPTDVEADRMAETILTRAREAAVEEEAP